MTIQRPAWNGAFRVDIIDDSSVLLLSEKDCLLLEGRAFPALAQLLDGTRSVEAVEDALADRFFPPEVTCALEIGIARGVIVEGSRGPGGEAALWNALGHDPDRLRARLEKTPVAVSALGGIATGGVVDALIGAGIRIDADAAMRLVVTDDYLRPELQDIGRESLRLERPWMIVRPIGSMMWFGPLFVPGLTGCWDCLAQRLRMNRFAERFLEERLPPGTLVTTPAVSAPPTEQVGRSIMALELVRAIGRPETSPLLGAVVTLDLGSLRTEQHALVRRPQCPACGTPPGSGPPPRITLAARPKLLPREGRHRPASAEATLARVQRHVSRITGVVRSLEPFGDLAQSGLVHTYVSGHNFAISHMDLKFVLGNLRGRSGGKGATEVQAKISAICEAIERYSGCFHGDEMRVRASLAEMGDSALHPNRLMCFSEAQIRDRAKWNALNPSPFHRAPEPLDHARPIDWTPARSLLDGSIRHVPSAYAYFGHPDLKAGPFCPADSNGNAAGDTLEDAILQGFLELVERDAVAVTWYNRIPRPGVDLRSFGDPYYERLERYYESIGRSFHVLDWTHDLGIPVFAAVSARIDGGSTEDIVVGFGAHLDPRFALLRSVTELNQFLPAVNLRDELGRTIYRFQEPEAIAWWKTARMADHPHLRADQALSPRSAGDFVDLSTDDVRDDVEVCLDIARRHALDVLVVDQTRPDVEMPVVKVMAPGLRHMWKRFGPGRLYDVPVQLGWVKRALGEEELNACGVFF